mmetsp:Transcript_15202/g.34676  ORF Transcript_15202/g.34676 Transcript_15202/m.34676 type:complete len:343 (-) Transcript_15202:618-1646(-)
MGKVGVAKLEAWVGIALDQPDPEVCVNHKVKAKDLKATINLARIELWSCSPNRICHESLQLWDKLLIDTEATLRVMLIQIPLELIQRHLVGRFVLSIVLSLVLNSVIVQMDELVETLGGVLDTRCAQVGISVGICTDGTSMRLLYSQAVRTDVKLSPVNQEGVLDVLLDDPRSVSLGSHTGSHFLCGAIDLDATPSVAPLARFDQPYPLVRLLTEGPESLLPRLQRGLITSCTNNSSERDRSIRINPMGSEKFHHSLAQPTLRAESRTSFKVIVNTKGCRLRTQACASVVCQVALCRSHALDPSTPHCCGHFQRALLIRGHTYSRAAVGHCIQETLALVLRP